MNIKNIVTEDHLKMLKVIQRINSSFDIKSVKFGYSLDSGETVSYEDYFVFTSNLKDLLESFNFVSINAPLRLISNTIRIEVTGLKLKKESL